MKRIFIDAGHGGKDPGAVSPTDIEKHNNLIMAIACRDHLNENYSGHLVTMTRTTDIQFLLEQIVSKAKSFQPDLFVSIHTNAGGGTGFETFIEHDAPQGYVDMQNILHTSIYNEIYKPNGFFDRGKKRFNFYVLRKTDFPSILTENLFIDTKKDAAFIANDNNLKKIGIAHANAIAKYLALPKKVKTLPGGVKVAPKPTAYHRVQVGAFKNKAGANIQAEKLHKLGYRTYIPFIDGFHKVQVGAFENKDGAVRLEKELQGKGFKTIIDSPATSKTTYVAPKVTAKPTPPPIKKGDTIRVKVGAKDLNTKATYLNFVYKTNYKVIAIGSTWVSFGTSRGVPVGKTAITNIYRV